MRRRCPFSRLSKFDRHRRRRVLFGPHWGCFALQLCKEICGCFRFRFCIPHSPPQAVQESVQLVGLISSTKSLAAVCETLAGSIAYMELTPFLESEVSGSSPNAAQTLWVRGGFPDSFLAETEVQSFE
jgi:hypothetical protein